MSTLTFHPVLEALGAALLQFVWQGALLALVLVAINALARKASAAFRYAAACAILSLMAAAFVATVFENYAWVTPVVSSPLTARVPSSPAKTVLDVVTPLPASPAAAGVPDWVACVWLLGVAALSIYTAGGWVRMRKLTRRGTEPLGAAWLATLEDLKQRLRISRPVRLCASAVADAPAVIGWLRPHILLPVTALTGLDESQLRAILAHELAHIRRHDYLVNLIQTAVGTLLFYHPAVWWVSRQIRRERENCCDDIAVAVCGDAVGYASALADLEQMRSKIPEPALAATGGELLGRIRRLLGETPSETRAAGSPGAILGAVLVLLIAGAPALLSQARPAFDVTSVKLNKSGERGQYFRPSGGGMSITNMPLKNVIMWAYDVRDFQVMGGPSWITSDHYDIEGRAQGNTSRDRLRPMMQSLLADRFGLALHKEIKEQPIYELTVAKSGLKIRALKPGDCLPFDPQNLSPAPGKTRLDYCGYGGFGPGLFEASSTDMQQLAQSLSTAVGRTVVDKTGVAGTFRVHLEYVRDESLPRLGPPPDPNDPPPAAEPGPTIFTALQEQLGLKLESGKGPVEMLVIDRVEKPAAN